MEESEFLSYKQSRIDKLEETSSTLSIKTK